MPALPVLAVIAGIVLLALGIHVTLAILLIAIPLGLMLIVLIAAIAGFRRVWRKSSPMFNDFRL